MPTQEPELMMQPFSKWQKSQHSQGQDTQQLGAAEQKNAARAGVEPSACPIQARGPFEWQNQQARSLWQDQCWIDDHL